MDTLPLLQTLEILLKAGGAKNALLILPLPPTSEREALPEFVRLLKDGELGDDCEVTMDEIEMIRGRKDNDGDGEMYKLLRLRISYLPSNS